MHKDSTAVRDQVLGGSLFRSLPPVDPTLVPVSPPDARQARFHIEEAVRSLTRLSRSINAYATDDQFDQPNAADLAIEELGLALAALSGDGM